MTQELDEAKGGDQKVAEHTIVRLGRKRKQFEANNRTTCYEAGPRRWFAECTDQSPLLTIDRKNVPWKWRLPAQWRKPRPLQRRIPKIRKGSRRNSSRSSRRSEEKKAPALRILHQQDKLSRRAGWDDRTGTAHLSLKQLDEEYTAKQDQ